MQDHKRERKSSVVAYDMCSILYLDLPRMLDGNMKQGYREAKDQHPAVKILERELAGSLENDSFSS